VESVEVSVWTNEVARKGCCGSRLFESELDKHGICSVALQRLQLKTETFKPVPRTWSRPEVHRDRTVICPIHYGIRKDQS